MGLVARSQYLEPKPFSNLGSLLQDCQDGAASDQTQDPEEAYQEVQAPSVWQENRCKGADLNLRPIFPKRERLRGQRRFWKSKSKNAAELQKSWNLGYGGSCVEPVREHQYIGLWKPARCLKNYAGKLLHYGTFRAESLELFLQEAWRKQKGIDSRVRRKFKGCGVIQPNIGYGSNRKTRHLLPSGMTLLWAAFPSFIP